MKKGIVLFIDTVHEILEHTLKGYDISCVDATQWSREQIIERLPETEGIVIRSRVKLDKELLSKATRLKFIARAGAGMENIDVDYANEAGIACINAPEGNRDAVGEHAMGMLLSLLNKLVLVDSEVRNGIWKREENRGIEIKGKTISIIGFGNTGSSFAKKLSGFEAEILAYDPYIEINKQLFPFVKQTTLDEIFEKTDILSLHVPLTDETRYMINTGFIHSFLKSFYLVNTARGKAVNTKDLTDAIQQGKITGAALDVLEYESLSFESLNAADLPEPFRFLINSNKVVLSPHIAGWTIESNRKISEVLATKILSIY